MPRSSCVPSSKAVQLRSSQLTRLATFCWQMKQLNTCSLLKGSPCKARKSTLISQLCKRSSKPNSRGYFGPLCSAQGKGAGRFRKSCESSCLRRLPAAVRKLRPCLCGYPCRTNGGKLVAFFTSCRRAKNARKKLVFPYRASHLVAGASLLCSLNAFQATFTHSLALPDRTQPQSPRA